MFTRKPTAVVSHVDLHVHLFDLWKTVTRHRSQAVLISDVKYKHHFKIHALEAYSLDQLV